MLRIGILGTRGIPNRYGGYEQLAQKLSVGLAERGHEVFVYNQHHHPYLSNKWNGVNIIHCFDPEFIVGMAGQFIYDLNCTIDARKRKFDVLLILGYTSSSVWGWLYPEDTVCINHMDGLEWQRKKYSLPVRSFLKYAEKLAVRFSRFYIADSPVIKTYLKTKYNIDGHYLAYGADIIYSSQKEPVAETRNNSKPYHLLIARMEKENNIEMILDGMHKSNTDANFMVVGNIHSGFGRFLCRKYKKDTRIQFLGAIYDEAVTGKLKTNCTLYFHGHSVGGTNPSLLEAMASGATLCAHDNAFNRAILAEGGYYFSSANDVKALIEGSYAADTLSLMRQRNLSAIQASFNWPNVIKSYEQFIMACYNHQQHERSIIYKGYFR